MGFGAVRLFKEMKAHNNTEDSIAAGCAKMFSPDAIYVLRNLRTCGSLEMYIRLGELKKGLGELVMLSCPHGPSKVIANLQVISRYDADYSQIVRKLHVSTL